MVIEDEERRILFYQFCKKLCYKSNEEKWHVEELATIFQNLYDMFTLINSTDLPNFKIIEAKKYMNSEIKDNLKEYLNSLKDYFDIISFEVSDIYDFFLNEQKTFLNNFSPMKSSFNINPIQTTWSNLMSHSINNNLEYMICSMTTLYYIITNEYYTIEVAEEEDSNLNLIEDDLFKEEKKEKSNFSTTFFSFLKTFIKISTFIGINILGFYNSKKENVYWNLNSNFWRKYFINSFDWKKLLVSGVLPSISFWFIYSYLFGSSINKKKMKPNPILIKTKENEEKKIEFDELKNSIERIIQIFKTHENNMKSILKDFKILNEKQMFLNNSTLLIMKSNNDEPNRKLSMSQFQASHKKVSETYTELSKIIKIQFQ